MRELSFYSKKINELKGKKEYLLKRQVVVETGIGDLKKRVLNIEKAQVFIQDVAARTQNALKFNVEGIVQLALDAVFLKEQYKFEINFVIKRDKTEASLSVNKNGFEMTPKDSNGGGLKDILGLALRFALWKYSRSRKLILLDEPFKNLSKDLQSKAGEILKLLSQKLGIQIIMITHEQELMEIADKTFEIQKVKDGEWEKSVVVVRN
ncbi:MAG: AAA family ATPase [Patescibacteria group bacterium]|jgi:DNA repair exonuclease SbcCD ATPase subunit